MTYAFGDFVLDLQLFQLRNGDQVIPLEPKVFDVLRYLVEHHDRVATKRELLDALWPNEVVTEAVLPTNINALRRALGQGRGEKTPIETVHGRGYRFSMPVSRGTSMPAPNMSLPMHSLMPGEDEEEPLVGQTVLVDKLKKVLARALSEQGQIVILRGETGIGKSRLAKRIGTIARGHGADVWVGACPEGLGTPPLWVWQEVLRSAKANEGGAGLRRFLGQSAAELSPWLYELLEDGEENPLSRGERDRFRLYDVLVRLLTSASKIRPRVIHLEDLHRADDASWQLLRLLAPHLENLAVLLVCTVRSRDDLTTAMPVQRHVEDLARLPFCSRFQVTGLSELETGQLLEKRLGRPIQPDLTRLLYQKTDGNPLFLRELSEGMMSTGNDADALRDAAGLSPPELVRRVLLRRVERLGEGAARVLSAASVLGSQFDLVTLSQVTGKTRSELMDIADLAAASRVIVPIPERLESYRFAHELIRDTLYTELKGQERKQLHLKLGEHLARQGDSNGNNVREVAQHFYRALPEGDPRRAVDWLLLAAEHCERQAAHDDAGGFYRYALDVVRLMSEPDPALRPRIESALEQIAQKKRAARASN